MVSLSDYSKIRAGTCEDRTMRSFKNNQNKIRLGKHAPHHTIPRVMQRVSIESFADTPIINQMPMDFLPELVYGYNITPHANTGHSQKHLLFGVDPNAPVDGLLGRELRKQDCLLILNDLLNEVYKQAKQYAEQKAAERLDLELAKVHGPSFNVC